MFIVAAAQSEKAIVTSNVFRRIDQRLEKDRAADLKKSETGIFIADDLIALASCRRRQEMGDRLGDGPQKASGMPVDSSTAKQDSYNR